MAADSGGEGEGFGDRPEGQHREEGEGTEDHQHHRRDAGEQAGVGAQGAGAGLQGRLAAEAIGQRQQGGDR